MLIVRIELPKSKTKINQIKYKMKNLIKIFTLLFLSFWAQNAFADDASDVKKFVNDFGNKIIKVASNPKASVETKRDQMVSLIDSVVDSEWIAKYVLAKNYRTATEEQKQRFRKLYREFMINTYAPAFKGYNGENFEVLDVQQQEKYFMVKCFFVPKEGPKVNLSFRLKKNQSGGFSVLDVIAEGVSLIETQRSEFGSVISSKGLNGFLDDLEVRVKNLKSGKKIDNSKK